ncbi:MAG: FAD-dependent oxidoreductase [Chitinophagaceae bacterium]|nr:FAD-dependent oxidoreductase [Chitinophagaceae bacterium]
MPLHAVKNNALKQLRKAFQLSRNANEKGTTDFESVAGDIQSHSITRRKFILDVTKAAAVIGAVGLYEACKPVNQKTQPVIAIVGGGIAGLHAAYILKNAGLIAQIYEGSPRTGGRIMSVDGMMGDGLWTEMGGEFIDSTHIDMLNLATKFNLPLIDRQAPSELGLNEFACFFDGKRYVLADVVKAIHPVAAQIQADIDSLSEIISFDTYTPADLALDNISITAYTEKLGLTGWFKEFINTSYTAEYGMEASEQSAINLLSIFDPGNGEEVKLYGDSDERYSVVGGNSKICNALSAELNEQIREEYLLTAIGMNPDNRYELTFRIGGKGEINTVADIVLMTIPFTTLREVDIKVPLPDWKMNTIKNVGYGTNSKLFIGVNERVWRQQGYAGYAFSDNGMMNGYDHTQMQNNNSGKGGYTIFLGGKAGVDCGNISLEDLQKQYVPALDGVFPGVSNQFNGNFQRWYWPGYAFSKCSYLSYKVGQYTTMCGTQIRPVGNLYFAGEHCSYEFQGFMNGGAATGRIAAEQIIAKLKV